jgi:hypothetical protein
VKATVACPLPAVAEVIAGAPGTVRGVTALEGADAGPVPALFDAVTVNVYAVPFDRPLTTIGLDGPLAVAPPGLAVTVYDVIGPPPSEAGAVKLTAA